MTSLTQQLLYSPEVSIGLSPDTLVLIDKSRHKRNGTFINHTKWTRLPTGVWVLDFDGVDDAVTIPFDRSTYNIPKMTICAWFNQREVKNQRLINCWQALQYDWLMSCPAGAPQNRMVVGKGGNAGAASKILPINTWYFACATLARNGANADTSIYINGVFGASASAGTAVPVSGSAMVIGQPASLDNTLCWNGPIGKIDIYSYLLSAGQILNLFESSRRLYGV
ncbi:MAG: LamG-like jellyroll fold domain-containing protein [Chloroflexota bacterium]